MHFRFLIVVILFLLGTTELFAQAKGDAPAPSGGFIEESTIMPAYIDLATWGMTPKVKRLLQKHTVDIIWRTGQYALGAGKPRPNGPPSKVVHIQAHRSGEKNRLQLVFEDTKDSAKTKTFTKENIPHEQLMLELRKMLYVAILGPVIFKQKENMLEKESEAKIEAFEKQAAQDEAVSTAVSQATLDQKAAEAEKKKLDAEKAKADAAAKKAQEATQGKDPKGDDSQSKKKSSESSKPLTDAEAIHKAAELAAQEAARLEAEKKKADAEAKAKSDAAKAALDAGKAVGSGEAAGAGTGAGGAAGKSAGGKGAGGAGAAGAAGAEAGAGASGAGKGMGAGAGSGKGGASAAGASSGGAGAGAGAGSSGAGKGAGAGAGAAAGKGAAGAGAAGAAGAGAGAAAAGAASSGAGAGGASAGGAVGAGGASGKAAGAGAGAGAQGGKGGASASTKGSGDKAGSGASGDAAGSASSGSAGAEAPKEKSSGSSQKDAKDKSADKDAAAVGDADKDKDGKNEKEKNAAKDAKEKSAMPGDAKTKTAASGAAGGKEARQKIRKAEREKIKAEKNAKIKKEEMVRQKEAVVEVEKAREAEKGLQRIEEQTREAKQGLLDKLGDVVMDKIVGVRQNQFSIGVNYFLHTVTTTHLIRVDTNFGFAGLQVGFRNIRVDVDAGGFYANAMMAKSFKTGSYAVPTWRHVDGGFIGPRFLYSVIGINLGLSNEPTLFVNLSDVGKPLEVLSENNTWYDVQLDTRFTLRDVRYSLAYIYSGLLSASLNKKSTLIPSQLSGMKHTIRLNVQIHQKFDTGLFASRMSMQSKDAGQPFKLEQTNVGAEINYSF